MVEKFKEDGKVGVNQGKKLQCTFTWEEKMSSIKKACFMLNFLNLKSLSSNSFFWVL